MKKRNKHFKEFIEQFADQVPGALYLYCVKPDGTASFPIANKNLESIFEIELSELEKDGTTAFARTHPDDIQTLQQSFDASLNPPQVWRCEYRLILPKRGVRWVRGHAQPEILPDKTIYLYGYIEDITEEKTLEINMQSQSKMLALAEMVSGLSHEFNNPLTIIAGKIHQLKNGLMQEALDRAKLSAYVDSLEASCLRLIRVMRGLDIFSNNVDAEQLSSVNLFQLVENLRLMFLAKFDQYEISFVVRGALDLKMDCSVSKITQAFVYLMSNSIDAVKEHEERWIRLEYETNENQVCIRFVDSGKGIPANIADRIMEPFFSTKEVNQGTGLGLSMVRGLIEFHNGTFLLNREAPNTTFEIRIPLGLASRLAS